MSSDNQHEAYMFFAGGVAGVMGKTAIAPLDRIKLQFQLANPLLEGEGNNRWKLVRAGRYLFRKEGFYGLYRGHSLTVLRIFPYAGINFLAYDFFKRQFAAIDEGRKLKKFLAGSSAGALSVTFTYPFDVLRNRLAFFSSDPINLRRASVAYSRSTFSFIMQGYMLTLCGIIPYAGVSLCSFDLLRSKYRTFTGNYLVPHEVNFIIGTFSGLLAQVASYPIDVLRKHRQLIGIASHLGSYEENRGLRILKKIYSNSGIRGFYRGVLLNFIKVGPSSGISFLTYEFLKQKFIA